MTSTHLSPSLESYGRSSAYSSYSHDRLNTVNRNTIPRAYIAPNTSSLENDFVISDKINPESSFEWQKSPSGHSVASSTTSDSGFQSVTMLTNGTLNRSPNSAFSPRIKSEPKDRLNSSEPVSDFQSLSFDSYYRSSSPVDTDTAYVKTTPESPTVQEEVPPIYGQEEENADLDSYHRVSSYSTMPRSLRRRKFAAQRSPQNAEDKESSNSSLNDVGTKSAQVNKPSTKFRADALLKNFIEQAEERDKKARLEQHTLTRTGRSRTRSASANKSGTTRSSSVGSDYRGFSTLRRSNSSVDMKDLITQAESRDRHARVEQARLRGLLPPRRHIPVKEPVKVLKARPASTIIQRYEDIKQPDDPFLKQNSESGPRSRTSSFTYSNFDQSHLSGTRSEYGAPTATTGIDLRPYRTSQISPTKKSPSSIHSDAGVNYSIARYTPRYREYRAKLSRDAEDVKHPTTRITNSSPRAAASMGNLQHAPEHDQSKSKALADWQKTWEAKRAQTTYQRNRAKSSSALNAATSPDPRNTTGDEQNRRKQVENLITGHVSPRQQEKSKFSPPGKSAAENLSRSRHMGSAQRSIDNPNYELQLPPPPTPPPVSPIAKSPELPTSQKDSPRSYVQPSPKGYRKPDTKSPSPKGSSHTMGRSVERQPEVARVAPTQKTDKSKSSTLPRHFKSGPTWDADSKQKAVQEQLNALRDEEIDELSAKIDSLSALEKNRLNNLLQEREFQRRVEEENRRIFSDEDLSDEGYDVPDRPDRDRLIRMQDDHAEQVDAQRDEEETFRREEERERRRQLERERKEEEEKERQLRERLQRERQFEEQERIREKEEQRRMDEERQKHEEEQRRYEEEMARREEERRQYEEERHRREIEKRQIEEERFRREEEKRLMEGERYRREEEKRQFEEMERREHDRRQQAQEERMRWEREEEEKQRRQRAFEERERMEREERQKERENELERLRSERDAHAKARQDIQRPTDEDEREEAERELLEKQLSQGKPSNFPKFSRPSAYGAASVYGRHTSTSATPYQSVTDRNKPVMRQHVDRGPRPVSDGYFLGKTDHLPETKNEMPNNSYISASNYNVSATSPTSSHSSRSPNNYVSSHRNPGVIGAQERYRDPRDRREAEIKREQSMKRRQQEPSYLTFKDRQRLFSQGQNSPLEKPKASKKLLEIESNLRKSQMS